MRRARRGSSDKLSKRPENPPGGLPKCLRLYLASEAFAGFVEAGSRPSFEVSVFAVVAWSVASAGAQGDCLTVCQGASSVVRARASLGSAKIMVMARSVFLSMRSLRTYGCYKRFGRRPLILE